MRKLLILLVAAVMMMSFSFTFSAETGAETGDVKNSFSFTALDNQIPVIEKEETKVFAQTGDEMIYTAQRDHAGLQAGAESIDIKSFVGQVKETAYKAKKADTYISPPITFYGFDEFPRGRI